MSTVQKNVSTGQGRLSAKALSESDVLIVGGGPAGCTAGILLARQGIETTILERNPPGYRKVCGDLIGSRSLQFLHALRIDWSRQQTAGLPIEGIRVYDEKGLKSVAYLEKKPGTDPVGVTLPRDRLDGYLQRKAQEAGCRLLHGVKFRDFLPEDKNARVCRASGEGRDLLFRARVVLGADGIRAATARAAGLFQTRPSVMLLAVRGYYRNVAGLRNTIDLYPLLTLQPGYAWVIPMSKDHANIGLGVRADVCSRDGVRLQKELARFLAEHPDLSRRMEYASAEGPVQGWPLTSYGSVQRRSGPHVLLLGDAGGFIDPLSGEGIFGAMQSAQIAVDVVREALRQDAFSAPFLASYDERCRRFFQADFGSAALVTTLLAHPTIGRPLAMWALKRVEKNCLLNQDYARMIAGLFTGLYPRKRFLRLKWLARTIFA